MEANRAGSLSHFIKQGSKEKGILAETSPTAIGHWQSADKEAKRQRQRKGEKTTLIPVSNSSQNKTADKEAENIEKLDVACLWGSAVLVGNI